MHAWEPTGYITSGPQPKMVVQFVLKRAPSNIYRNPHISPKYRISPAMEIKHNDTARVGYSIMKATHQTCELIMFTGGRDVCEEYNAFSINCSLYDV